MHQLWQHKNGVWYVLYGPRLKQRVSTGCRDRGPAETYLAQFIAGHDSPIIDAPTVGEVLRGYADDHGKTLRGQDGLKYSVVALDRHLRDLQPQQLLPNVIKDYAKKRSAEGVSAGTILREVGVLRAACGWGHDRKWYPERPRIPDPVRRPRSRERWMPREEAGRLVAACQMLHLRLFTRLGIMTLARTGAILELPWTAEDDGGAHVNLPKRWIDYGEGWGNKHRVIAPINDELAEDLAAAQRIACTNRVIEAHGKPVSSVKKGFAAACRRAGITGVTPHVLRHTGATWLVEDGVPIAEVARMLGDTEEMVRKVYGHHSPDFLKRAASALQMGKLPAPPALQLKGNPRI